MPKSIFYTRRRLLLLSFSQNENTDGIDQKVHALQKAVEKEFDFDTCHIPESVIDAFVEYVRVEKDKYIWKLSLLDGEFTCLASGKAKRPDVSLVDIPSYVSSGTGCNQPKGAIIFPIGLIS